MRLRCMRFFPSRQRKAFPVTNEEPETRASARPCAKPSFAETENVRELRAENHPKLGGQ